MPEDRMHRDPRIPEPWLPAMASRDDALTYVQTPDCGRHRQYGCRTPRETPGTSTRSDSKPAAHCCSPPTGQRLLANELSTRYALAQRRWESNCSSTLADSRSDYQVALAAMRASGAEAL